MRGSSQVDIRDPIDEAWEAADKRDVDKLIALVDSSYERRGVFASVEAIRALGKLGDGKAVPALIGLLDSGDSLVRSAASIALGRIGDSRAVEPLRRTAEVDGNEATRHWAVDSLSRIGDPGATPLLMDLLDDPRWGIRKWAATRLADHGDSRGLRPLQKRVRRERLLNRWYMEKQRRRLERRLFQPSRRLGIGSHTPGKR